MSKVFIEETTLSSIGDAIREKTGKTDLIAPGDMPTEIGAITTSSGDGDSGDSNTIPESFIDGTWNGEYINNEITQIREGAFYNTKITKIEAQNVIRVEAYAFCQDTNLQEIKLPNVQFLGEYAFNCGTTSYNRGQNKLVEQLDFPELIWMASDESLKGFDNVTELILPKCQKVCGLVGFSHLKKLILPSVQSIYNVLGYTSDYFCLQSVICPNFGNTNKDSKYDNRSMSFGFIGQQNFRYLPLLDTFVIGGKNYVVPLTNTYSFGNTPISKGTGYIYVRKALIEEYKTATNWSMFADQFRAIEDYPEIEEELAQYD